LIRPEHVILQRLGDHTGDAAVNRFRGRVVQVAFFGEAIECIVQIGSVAIVVRSIAGQFSGADDVDVFFPPERISAIAVDNE